MADAAATPDIGVSLASGLGTLLGSGVALASTQQGMSDVTNLTNIGAAQVAPYNFAGANYLGPVGQDLLGDTTGSKNIGNQRINADVNPVDFEDFAKNYNASEGAQYLMRNAAEAQDSSAAAKGGLLSGANLRAQTTMAEKIANTDLLEQYKAMAFGQQQDFQQRETSYQNMYGQEAMGLQAGIAEAGTYAQGARAIGSLASAQASNAQSGASSFGSALGSIFTGLSKAFGFGA